MSFVSLIPVATYQALVPVFQEIQSLEGSVFFVGGFVRDYYLNIDSSENDIDIEVHGLEYDQLYTIIERYMQIDFEERLKVYGVIKTPFAGVDWSIPRRDGEGRFPNVELDPFLDIDTALSRRDLTINSIAWEWQEEGEWIIYDPFNGIPDCEKRFARATNPNTFAQDPMRFYRLLEYIGKFDLSVGKVLKEIATMMILDGMSSKKQSELLHTILLDSLYKDTVKKFLIEIKKEYLLSNLQ